MRARCVCVRICNGKSLVILRNEVTKDLPPKMGILRFAQNDTVIGEILRFAQNDRRKNMGLPCRSPMFVFWLFTGTS